MAHKANATECDTPIPMPQTSQPEPDATECDTPTPMPQTSQLAETPTSIRRCHTLAVTASNPPEVLALRILSAALTILVLLEPASASSTTSHKNRRPTIRYFIATAYSVDGTGASGKWSHPGSVAADRVWNVYWRRLSPISEKVKQDARGGTCPRDSAALSMRDSG
jgi:hypothetical protein